MRHCRRYVIILAVACLCAVHSTLFANNLAVSSLSLTGMNSASDFILVKFNVSWENSWRTSIGPSNWDAAWVFVKFRVGDSNPILTGASSSTTTVTVSSTANLRAGMPVRVTSGTGAFAANTVISSITNSTQFVVSATPATPLSNASIECTRIWEHARLNDNGHTAPSGSTIDAGLLAPGTAFNATSNPALGVFLYRSSVGAGSNSFNNVQVRWNYGANGVADDAVISIRLFAVEMVYVPQGAFFVGSGGTDYHEWGSMTDGSKSFGPQGVSTSPQGRTSIPFRITGESAIDIDNVSGRLWGMSNDLSVNQNDRGHHMGNSTDAAVSLPAAFPKGFGAFYCMKYEMSQGQYRDYLNTLTCQQQTLHHFNGTPESGVGTKINASTWNYIEIRTPGNSTTNTPAVYGADQSGNNIYDESNDGASLASTSGTYYTLASYLDWSGLRLMTELEYEKACRGTLSPVPNEYAWGTTNIVANTSITNRGSVNETATNGNFSGKSGTYNPNAATATTATSTNPTRVGAFAGNATAREAAGAAYYGMMDMTGGHWEQVVNVARNEGRAYTGLHGDGSLSSTGHHNVTNWPSTPPYEGAGLRGGAWSSNWGNYMSYSVSGRNVGAFRTGVVQGQNFWEVIGGRGVRTAQ